MTGVVDYGRSQTYLRGGSRASVTELVAAVLEAQADVPLHGPTRPDGLEIRHHPDAGLAGDFIGWPFTIEAESEEPGPALVEAVSLVLRAAWNRGLDAVAACDFEDELPDLGGITRYR
ncbi:hypothetical protein GXW83_15635 [Streptacidiphilus sp. PB12-B1b]|uniref:hypothetical protein n=1 Tax=Streptacidiphilus sp. PB12-B1b TaxID=2705012 RepID=UPI0015FC0DE3|nr:hypothetical protein [Streptacidiphilus sp. PB12-B1b]QMU76938.1 hypothetical protein GXW83_15635 [Streptacidiphilus sp. PB12-B1b]